MNQVTNIIAATGEKRKRLFYKELAGTAIKTTQKLYEALLEAERDEAVGAGRYEQTAGRKDYRNGYTAKWFDTRWGRYRLAIPRTRRSGWTSKIVKRFGTMDDDLVRFVQYLVFSGTSIRMAVPLVENLVGGQISTSRISFIVRKIDYEIMEWRKSSLADKQYDVVIIDGIWMKLWKGHKKNGKNQEKRVAITALGISGENVEVIDFEVAGSESEDNVTPLLQRLYERGIEPEQIEMMLNDGAGGIDSSVSVVFGNIPTQRCTMHKLGNLRSALSDMPAVRKIVMEQAKDIFKAETHDSFLERVKRFKRNWLSLSDKKRGFEDGLEKCGTYLITGCRHRTTALLENRFRHMRRLIRIQSHYVSDKSIERYFYGQLLLRGYIRAPACSKLYTKFLT